MGTKKTVEQPGDGAGSATTPVAGAAPQQGGDGLSAKPSEGPRQGRPKKFEPYFRLDKKYVKRLAGFDIARVRNRLVRWIERNKGDARAGAVREVVTRLAIDEGMLGPQTYGRFRWGVGVSRGITSLRRLRSYVEVRHEEAVYYLSRAIYPREPFERKVEQFARARQLVDELSGLLEELEPKFHKRDKDFIAHLFRVPRVLKARPPDARYLGVTQRRLREAGLRLKEIARLFARAKADDAAIAVEAERIRVRIRTLNAEDRKEGRTPLLRWSGVLVGRIVSLVMRDMRHARLSMHDQRRVCVEAPCDPRTLRKYLDGQPIRPMAMASIKRALKALGFELEAEPSRAMR